MFGLIHEQNLLPHCWLSILEANLGKTMSFLSKIKSLKEFMYLLISKPVLFMEKMEKANCLFISFHFFEREEKTHREERQGERKDFLSTSSLWS